MNYKINAYILLTVKYSRHAFSPLLVRIVNSHIKTFYLCGATG